MPFSPWRDIWRSSIHNSDSSNDSSTSHYTSRHVSRLHHTYQRWLCSISYHFTETVSYKQLYPGSHAPPCRYTQKVAVLSCFPPWSILQVHCPPAGFSSWWCKAQTAFSNIRHQSMVWVRNQHPYRDCSYNGLDLLGGVQPSWMEITGVHTLPCNTSRSSVVNMLCQACR